MAEIAMMPRADKLAMLKACFASVGTAFDVDQIDIDSRATDAVLNESLFRLATLVRIATGEKLTPSALSQAIRQRQ